MGKFTEEEKRVLRNLRDGIYQVSPDAIPTNTETRDRAMKARQKLLDDGYVSVFKGALKLTGAGQAAVDNLDRVPQEAEPVGPSIDELVRSLGPDATTMLKEFDLNTGRYPETLCYATTVVNWLFANGYIRNDQWPLVLTDRGVAVAGYLHAQDAKNAPVGKVARPDEDTLHASLRNELEHEKREHAASRAAVRSLTRERDDAQMNLDACASECMDLRRKVESLTRERDNCAKSLVGATRDRDDLDGMLTDLRRKNDALIQQNKNLTEALEGRDKALAETLDKNVKLSAELNGLASECNGLKAENDDLRRAEEKRVVLGVDPAAEGGETVDRQTELDESIVRQAAPIDKLADEAVLRKLMKDFNRSIAERLRKEHEEAEALAPYIAPFGNVDAWREIGEREAGVFAGRLDEEHVRREQEARNVDAANRLLKAHQLINSDRYVDNGTKVLLRKLANVLVG